MKLLRWSPLLIVLAASLLVTISWIQTEEAAAFPSYVNAFQNAYPLSQTDDNVIDGVGSGCQICHRDPNGGNPWNGYGWALRQLTQTGFDIDEALPMVEQLDSDEDPLLSSNLSEITGDTQPGWTAGPNNNHYFSNGLIIMDQLPPPDILGDLDPGTTPEISISPLTVDFGTVVQGMSGSGSINIENVGFDTLTVSGLSFDNTEFSLDVGAPPLPIVLASGEMVDVPLLYSPVDIGDDMATLTVSSDDPDDPMVNVTLLGSGASPLPQFRRGDCNADGGLDIGDAIFLLTELFSGGMPGPCADACDTNDDGMKDIGDAIYTLSNLFSGGPAPLPPFPDCGDDPSMDALDCGSFDPCL